MRDFIKAIRAGWKAGLAQFHRVRWHQRRIAELNRHLPF